MPRTTLLDHAQRQRFVEAGGGEHVPHLGQHPILARCGARAPSAPARPRESCRSRGSGRPLRPGRSRGSDRAARRGHHFDRCAASARSSRLPSAARICRHALRRNLDAQNPPQLRRAQHHRLAAAGCRPTSITPSASSPPASSKISSHARRLAQSTPSRIESPLEAIRRVAVQAQATGGGADRERIELGRLHQQSVRCGRDFALGPAHHSAQRHGARRRRQ